LKTLKKKQNSSLILDEEFIQYCDLNNIDDIEKLAKEVFKKGFDILKYGSVPSIHIESKTERSKTVRSDVYVQPHIPLQVIDGKSSPEIKKDIYGE